VWPAGQALADYARLIYALKRDVLASESSARSIITIIRSTTTRSRSIITIIRATTTLARSIITIIRATTTRARSHALSVACGAARTLTDCAPPHRRTAGLSQVR
jgi:hypothetical protein